LVVLIEITTPSTGSGAAVTALAIITPTTTITKGHHRCPRSMLQPWN
jgi:hypothetical protein